MEATSDKSILCPVLLESTHSGIPFKDFISRVSSIPSYPPQRTTEGTDWVCEPRVNNRLGLLLMLILDFRTVLVTCLSSLRSLSVTFIYLVSPSDHFVKNRFLTGVFKQLIHAVFSTPYDPGVLKRIQPSFSFPSPTSSFALIIHSCGLHGAQ